MKAVPVKGHLPTPGLAANSQTPEAGPSSMHAVSFVRFAWAVAGEPFVGRLDRRLLSALCASLRNLLLMLLLLQIVMILLLLPLFCAHCRLPPVADLYVKRLGSG